jgi:mRNA-degrading endonuclease YafQ of YafQ-DinJ toxin-antitoxin module
MEFNPWHPVVCVADPSGGVNEYAVLVFQDYGPDRMDVIDEFYRSGVTAEEVAAELDMRVWRNWVSVIYLDQGSNPIEIQRWAQCDWPAAPIVSENRKSEIVPGKPDLDSSVPIVNNTFRNPLRWRQYERNVMKRVLDDAGYDTLDEVPENKRPQLAMELEERLADHALVGDDLEALRDCSGIRISKDHCPNLAHELAGYRKRRFRDPTQVDARLSIRMTADHLCDCLRYMCWMHRRHLWQAGMASSYLELDVASDSGYQGTNWLESVRMQLLGRRYEGSTYLARS